MARVRRWWWSSHPFLIWSFSAFLFFALFHFALRNSSHDPHSPSSDASVLNKERRSRLYDKMEKDLDEHGAAFLKHGETSQSLSLSDIFTLQHGVVAPIHKAADPPVRANVLYLSPEYSVPISNAVRRIFHPYFDKGLNSSLYHFSMFHASHHSTPVPATGNEVAGEAASVKAVVESLCPLKIVLDRVVLTSTGVLLGCWQVVSGTDPISVRAKLRNALPRAPQKQLYDAAILHTSFARLLGQPKISHVDPHKALSDVQFFHKLVDDINNEIRGFEAMVSELWYVEEYDVLALALDGRMKARRFQFHCSRA